MTTLVDAAEWTGEFRAPRNMAAEVKGSIHDDATASKLGFKGGTVAGSIHMDQFVPKIVEVHGDGWFNNGSLSLYFTQATVDGEKVRAVVQPGERSRLRMYNEPGALICEGTAAVGGPDAESELSRRIAAQAPVEPAALRILRDLRAGDTNHDLTVQVTGEMLDKARAVITEDLAAYRDERILPPSLCVRLAHQTRPTVMAKAIQPHVGLFGALEVQQLDGPLKADVTYRARTEILKLTESPKTENVWYDVTFSDADRDVARVRYLLRVLRASSPLYG